MIMIPIMAFIARLCGASWTPKRFPAELVWGLIIALLVSATLEQLIIFTVWGYVAMQLGHGRFYAMNGANLVDPNPETIETYIQKLYKGDITKPLYSWVCMGTKGALIALPLGLAAAACNAILWPLFYYVGHRIIKKPEWAEILSGAGLGFLMWGAM
jgi:hypothetical protein